MDKRLDLALLILRLTFGGLLLLLHGWPKFQLLVEGKLNKFQDPIGIGEPASLILAVLAEFLCSIMIMLGLLTRWASIPIIITMLVIIFAVKGGGPLDNMELALLYLAPFVAFLILGPGYYSLDHQFKIKR